MTRPPRQKAELLMTVQGLNDEKEKRLVVMGEVFTEDLFQHLRGRLYATRTMSVLDDEPDEPDSVTVVEYDVSFPSTVLLLTPGSEKGNEQVMAKMQEVFADAVNRSHWEFDGQFFRDLDKRTKDSRTKVDVLAQPEIGQEGQAILGNDLLGAIETDARWVPPATEEDAMSGNIGRIDKTVLLMHVHGTMSPVAHAVRLLPPEPGTVWVSGAQNLRIEEGRLRWAMTMKTSFTDGPFFHFSVY